MKFAPMIVCLVLSSQAMAGELKRDLSKPDAPIANSVLIAPGSTLLFVAGQVSAPVNGQAGPAAEYGDTRAQTMSALTNLQTSLTKQGMDLGDVAMMRVYLVADPATGKMDFAGMNEAYRKFFANPAQPRQPARVTIQVAQLANPKLLVEIEAQAAKAP